MAGTCKPVCSAKFFTPIFYTFCTSRGGTRQKIRQLGENKRKTGSNKLTPHPPGRGQSIENEARARP